MAEGFGRRVKDKEKEANFLLLSYRTGQRHRKEPPGGYKLSDHSPKQLKIRIIGGGVTVLPGPSPSPCVLL